MEVNQKMEIKKFVNPSTTLKNILVIIESFFVKKKYQNLILLKK